MVSNPSILHQAHLSSQQSGFVQRGNASQEPFSFNKFFKYHCRALERSLFRAPINTADAQPSLQSPSHQSHSSRSPSPITHCSLIIETNTHLPHRIYAVRHVFLQSSKPKHNSESITTKSPALNSGCMLLSSS